MSDPVTFSIITVCKNPGASFLRTLESLREQVFRNFEWIVIDGASDDGTAGRLLEHKGIIAKSLSEPDKGIYDAMNKGIALAAGDYIYFLNSGDTFHDGNVLRRVDEFIRRKGGDLVYGDTSLIDPVTKESRVKSHRQVDKYYLFNRPINHQAIFARRSLFSDVGLFDLTFVVKADHDWIMRCLVYGAVFEHIELVVSNYLLQGFAYQNRAAYRSLEKRRIQRSYFKWIGRMGVRGLNRLRVDPPERLRRFLNKLL